MESIRKIYKIGYGPSSSHTMGPGYASEIFLERNQSADHFEVVLYGSLALTGKGHMTDVIIKKILGNFRTNIVFDLVTVYEYHTNGMLFKAYKNDEMIDKWLVFSVGGGDLKELGEPRDTFSEMIYQEKTMAEILDFCSTNNMNLVQYVEYYEGKEIRDYLKQVLDVMGTCINKGIYTDGILPGGLNVERKASTFYKKYLQYKHKNELTFAYSLAVSEENASGNVIVTAPTCGASGVVPSALYSQKVLFNRTDEQLINALMVGGLIGNIVKTNASISGAEVGCQGEVGVACSMAAAMIAYLFGANNQTIEYAAEIALEHHLGLTCDPVNGLVQIPCIERNAIASLSAFNSAEYALLAGSEHSVTLDSIIKVMCETGKDLQDKYKETSKGGLALHHK